MVEVNKSALAEEKKPFCFVVGPIGKDGSPERKHADMLLHALIRYVLMAEEFGYVVKRADEDADPGMIGDRAVSDIIQAELFVADLTDLNPNAFYELGKRHSTEKPTIHVAKIGTVLPFDTVAHRTIFVDVADRHSLESARGRLASSVRAIKSPGYRVNNPITQANASFKMRQSEDPRDRLLVSIQDRLRALEAESGKRVDAFDVEEFYGEMREIATYEWEKGGSIDAIETMLVTHAASRGIQLHVKASTATQAGGYRIELFANGLYLVIMLLPREVRSRVR
jgi:hypothetical protein